MMADSAPNGIASRARRVNLDGSIFREFFAKRGAELRRCQLGS